LVVERVEEILKIMAVKQGIAEVERNESFK
jgi:hypothetical protein